MPLPPWSSLLGGLLIGVDAARFALLNGRMAGISGVLGRLLKPVRGDVGLRVAFIAGLVGAPVLYARFSVVPAVQIDASYGAVVAAGLRSWASAPVTAQAVPAAIAFVVCRGSRSVFWQRRSR